MRKNVPFACSTKYSHSSPYWSASQSASLVVRHGLPSKRATSSRVALPTSIFSACFVCASCATALVHSQVTRRVISVSCTTENAARPNTASTINGILVFICEPFCRATDHIVSVARLLLPLLPLLTL